jgi:hypothetical protein
MTDDRFRHITRVVLDGSDDTGVWLDDGSRLVFGNFEVTVRPGASAHMVTIRTASEAIEWKLK